MERERNLIIAPADIFVAEIMLYNTSDARNAPRKAECPVIANGPL